MIKIKHGNIQVTKEGDQLIVEDIVEGHLYKVNADEDGINTLGKTNSPWTWGEAFDEGRIAIQNDDLDGHSWGQHGSIFVEEEPFE